MSDDAQGLPTITIGKKQWPVPEFVWRDSKVLLPKLNKITKLDPLNVTEEDMNTLGDIAYIAISRANGGVKREDFDAMPISAREIMEALPIIIKQADLEAKKPGEPQAPPIPTGTT